jgi:hypothetical protein
MRQDVQESNPRPGSERARISPRRWGVIAAAFALLVVGGVVTSCWLRADRSSEADAQPAAGGSGPTVGVTVLDSHFRGWPAGKKPDVALMLTGQQHSYLKFCGCSQPQLGGFERRYNLFQALKAKGWPIVAADLGDLVEYKSGDVHDQALLKYETAMKALKALDYAAIGLGKSDFQLPLEKGLGLTLLQNMDAYPRVLSANLANAAQTYPHPEKPNESMIGDVVIAGGKNGAPTVGIVAVIGASVEKELRGTVNDKFDANDVVLKNALAKFERSKVDLKLLLFQGDHAGARKVAQGLPDKIPAGSFDVILCLSPEEDARGDPDKVGKTMIVQVGHRGRYIGVVGAFRTGKADKPFDFHYQMLAVGEEFETPKGQEAQNPILRLLDDYALSVKNQNFLAVYPRVNHPVMAKLRQKAEFVGSDKCKDCHQADYQIWKNSKHSHAYDALAKIADKPKNRQYDPECVRCHTIGFGFNDGFVDKNRTAHLTDVGCENCHGPGSLHVAQPKNAEFLAAQSPWKVKPTDRLPKPDVLAKGFDAMNPAEQDIYKRVNAVCYKCHDSDNDPAYKFSEFWPKVIHGKK